MEADAQFSSALVFRFSGAVSTCFWTIVYDPRTAPSYIKTLVVFSLCGGSNCCWFRFSRIRFPSRFSAMLLDCDESSIYLSALIRRLLCS